MARLAPHIIVYGSRHFQPSVMSFSPLMSPLIVSVSLFFTGMQAVATILIPLVQLFHNAKVLEAYS